MIRRGALYPTFEQPLTIARMGLLALVAVEIAVAVGLHANGAPSNVQLINQVALAVTFTALAVADLRLAVAICVLELIVGGASGRWTVLPAGVSGRMLLDVIVGLVSVLVLARQARDGVLALGRYTVHALAIAILIPAIWIPLGVFNGNGLANAVADGDGFLFFGFAVILAAVALRGELGWLRRWILISSVIGAALTVLVVALLASGAVAHRELQVVFTWTFDMGGRIDAGVAGIRVYFASGLFLQVGVAIAIWELMRNRHRAWLWAALAILLIALFVSFTRGFWLGAVIAASVVLIFGRENASSVLADRNRRLVTVALGIGIAAFLVVALFGIGGGMGSNLVKIYQAAVLLWHTIQRPLTGWGLGAVVPDYVFGTGFTYEITYFDRAFKLGFLGLALFLSLPIRLLIDSWRVLNGRLAGALGVSTREAVVPLAILASVLVVSATNPYMVGSVGIGAVVLTIAWLDPFRPKETPT
ncbi:MAG TPA: hypothetical protein VEX62_10995 [Candidatus Limnocylindrales bacterium]|nr:hypothetical protein [Candidatus Limnocylindrales bacterium]